MEDFDALKPRTTAACLRRYWAKVDHLLSEGVSQTDIVKVLNAEGVNVTIQAFRVYLHQHRKKCEAQSTGSKPTPRLPVLPPGTGGAKPSLSMGDLQSAAAIEQSMPHLSKKERRKTHSEQYVNPVSCNPFSSQIKENES